MLHLIAFNVGGFLSIPISGKKLWIFDALNVLTIAITMNWSRSGLYLELFIFISNLSSQLYINWSECQIGWPVLFHDISLY